MQQLQLDLGLPPQSAITPPIPLTADLKRALVTQMATAIITVYQAGGPQSDRVSAPVFGAPGAASHRKPTLAV